jgi:hypothetical protein
MWAVSVGPVVSVRVVRVERTCGAGGVGAVVLCTWARCVRVGWVDDVDAGRAAAAAAQSRRSASQRAFVLSLCGGTPGTDKIEF